MAAFTPAGALMRRSIPVLACFLVLVAFCSYAEDNRVVRVGVAIMQNEAGRSVPGNIERDRLVRALDELKADKKTHIKVEGVPLEGSSGNELSEEAEQKKCEYVLYTTLTELRNASDPYQRRPGTIETNPNGTWNSRDPSAQRLDPEYRATVEYKLYNLRTHTTSGSAPFLNQQAMNEIDVVSQIMDRIASRVFSDIKKGGLPPPMRE